MVIDKRLKVWKLYDCLYGFLTDRGTGTEMLLTYIKTVLLYKFFVDLKKAFDAMDCKRCMQILKDQCTDKKIRTLIKNFWRLAELVCRAGGCYGRPFKAWRGVTQGGMLSPRLFNHIVVAVIQEWLQYMMGADAATNGIRE